MALLLSSPAMAQQRGGGNQFILLNKSVQEELKVEQAQIDKATEAFKKFSEDNKDLVAKLRDRNLSQEDRAEARKQMTEATQKIAADVLKPEQLKRLKEIQLQQAGIGAFNRADSQKALNLTDKQKDELKTIADDLRKQSAEIRQNAGTNRQEAREKTQALTKDKMEAALKVLTDDQKKTWKDLLGASFEMRRQRPNQ
jgi:hypothetical protein